MRTLQTNIHIIGPGKVGESIIAGLLHSRRYRTSQISASSGKQSPRLRELARKYRGVRLSTSNQRHLRHADVVILAVKPQAIQQVAAEIAGKLRPNQLVVSCAAIVDLAELQELLRHQAVVRAMPNLAVRVGLGCTRVLTSTAVPRRHVRLVYEIFSALGTVCAGTDDASIDRFTIESGTGLAVAAAMLIGYKRGGIYLGESRAVAQQIALQVMRGAYSLLENGTYPSLEELVYDVMTPAGTTSRSMLALEEGGLVALVVRSMEAGMIKIAEAKAALQHKAK